MLSQRRKEPQNVVFLNQEIQGNLFNSEKTFCQQVSDKKSKRKKKRNFFLSLILKILSFVNGMGLTLVELETYFSLFNFKKENYRMKLKHET